MFPYQQGGMFRWVGEAFGEKLGFLGIWLQWIENTIWYPYRIDIRSCGSGFHRHEPWR